MCRVIKLLTTIHSIKFPPYPLGRAKCDSLYEVLIKEIAPDTELVLMIIDGGYM